jgi:transglutaminase-like putative cysteine protease
MNESRRQWEVGCRFDMEVTEPASVALSVAAARSPWLEVIDTFSVFVDGAPAAVESVVVDEPSGRRLYLLELPVGRVSLAYDAGITGSGSPPVSSPSVSPVEQLAFLRPSRYCPADRLGGWARREFDPAGTSDSADSADQVRLVEAVKRWVSERTDYVLGSSRGTDTAIDTLLSAQGVCRDFAHLVITICRALDLPARLVAVYAPGLDPMDFHAVAEVCIADRWSIYDATALAPRPALVRIATGRDAADTAFMTVHRGHAELIASTVTAVITGDLPTDPPTRVTLG